MATSSTRTSKSSTSKATASKPNASKATASKPNASASSRNRPAVSDVVARAGTALTTMTGHDVEGVVGIERLDDGWRVQIEVVELHRIPTTTDLLATYEVDLDSEAELTGFRRLRRYPRGQPRED